MLTSIIRSHTAAVLPEGQDSHLEVKYRTVHACCINPLLVEGMFDKLSKIVMQVIKMCRTHAAAVPD
jgi:hypothetical protein